MTHRCFSRTLFAALFFCALAGLSLSAGEFKTDDEGFIRNWLMLAPVKITEGDGPTLVEKDQIKDENKLAPKDGEKIKVGDKELAWKAIEVKDYYVDFHEVMKEKLEDVAGYLVCYVEAPEEMKDLVLAIGSNDFARVFLNGKEVLKVTEPGQIDKDKADVKGMTLNKGANTIVYKIINDKNNWQAALRFKTKDDKAVTGIKVKLAP